MDHLPELVHHSALKKGQGTQGWDKYVTQGTSGLQLAGVTKDTQVEVNTHM